MRIPIQVSIEGAVIKRLKEKGIPISILVNDICCRLDACQTASAEEITLAMMQAERDNIVRSIELNHEQIKKLEESIKFHDAKIAAQLKLILERQKSERVASYIAELNASLEDIFWEFEKAWKLPVLDKLRTEGLQITEAWLRRHIQRIETMGR